MRSATLFGGLLLLAGAASAQITETEAQKLLPAGYQSNDGIGRTLEAKGDWLFVAAVGDGVKLAQQGSVHVYRWNSQGWLESGLVVADDPSGFSLFGHSLACSGDTLLVGAPRHDIPGLPANHGMAFAFRLEGDEWVEEAQLLPAGLPVTSEFYAEQVALGGSRAFVLGDLDDPLGGPKTPTVFVFQRTEDGWVTEQPIIPEGTTQAEGTYKFMAATEDLFLIGMPYFDGPAGLDQGAVRIYERAGDEWTLAQTLFASDAVAGDRFGTTLDLEGNRLAVGAPVKCVVPGDLSGAAYVFRQDGDTWVEEFATGDDTPPGILLGSSVDLEGSLLFAGAQGYDTSALNAGAVFAWHRSGTAWTPAGQFLASDGAGGDMLGTVVIGSGPMVVASSPNDQSVPGFGVHGSAYSFDTLPPGWRHRGGSSAGAAGHPILTGAGQLAPGASVTLELQRAAPASAVFLLVGFTALEAPFHGGVLVPNPQLIISGLGTNAEGALILTGGWPGLPPGTKVYFQDWIVDPSATSGLAGSNGVEARVP